MKNFFIYSQKPLKSEFNPDEFLKVKVLERGIRFVYLVDFLGAFYAFKKGFRLLGSLILIITIVFNVLINGNENLLFLKWWFNVVLAVFGIEIEEFFAKRKGFKMEGFTFAKNMKNVEFMLESNVKIKVAKGKSFLEKATVKLKSIFKKTKLKGIV